MVFVGEGLARELTREELLSEIDVSGGVVAFADDFEGGGTNIHLERGADVVCDRAAGNCHMRQVAEPGADVFTEFGEPFWQDYVLRFSFNVRTGGGSANTEFRINNGNQFEIYANPNSGLELIARKDGMKFVVDKIDAPFSLRTWHLLEIGMMGTSVGLRLDGREIGAYDIPESRGPLQGFANVHTHANDGGSVEVWYDDVQIILLDGTVAEVVREEEVTPDEEEDFGGFQWSDPTEGLTIEFDQDFQASSVGLSPRGFSHAGDALRVTEGRSGNRYLVLATAQATREISELSSGTDELYFGDRGLNNYGVRLRLRFTNDRPGELIVCLRCNRDGGLFLSLDSSGHLELVGPDIGRIQAADLGPIPSSVFHRLVYSVFRNKLAVTWNGELVFERGNIPPSIGFAAIRVIDPVWHLDDIQLIAADIQQEPAVETTDDPLAAFQGFEPTPAEALCTFQAIGAEAATELGGGRRLPTLEEVAAMRHCFADGLVELLVASPLEEFGDSTVDQRLCALQSLGEDSFVELALQRRAPTFDESAILNDCYGQESVALIEEEEEPVSTPRTGGLTRGGTISGRVTDADTGQPVRGVQVQVVDARTGDYRTGNSTDFDGRYSVGSLPAGTYRLRAEGENTGYIREYYRDKPGFDRADAIEVGAGQEVTAIDFEISLGATISGRVVDSITGLPIRDINVNAEPESGGNQVGVGTNFDGRYTIRGLSTGAYRIRAQAQDLGYVELYYPGTTIQEEAELIPVAEGDELRGIDFALSTGSTISGRVTDEATGLPIARLQIFAESRFRGQGVWAETDFDGRYVLRGIAPGSYVVKAEDNEFGYIRTYYDDKTEWESADFLTVFEDDTITGIDFSLRQGATISGRVTDASTGLGVRVSVNADSREFGFGSGTGTEFDGTYEIKGLRPGGYVVKVRGEDQGYMVQYYSGELSWDTADTVIVGPDGATGIDFALKSGGSISGRVTDASTGLGISGMEVHADHVNTGEQVAWENTDPDGYYTLRGLPGGRIEVFVRGRGFVEVSRTVFLEDGEHLEGFDF